MAFSYKQYEESKAVQDARAKAQQYGTYNESQRVKDLQSQYDTLKTNKESTLSPYKTALDTALANINNRQAFSYDLNSDALYNQYKQQYMQLGKLAMQDTMGQAATLTGGYGNSYAASAGNQAYQNYLTQINDKVPELYGLAMDKYKMEGDDLANKYALASDRYNVENSDYQASLDRAYQDYNNERNYDYNQFTDNRAYYTDRYDTERANDISIYNLGYDLAKDTFDLNTKFDQWQKEFDENKRQYETSLAEEQRQYDKTLAEQQRQANLDYQLSLAKAASSGSSGSGKSSSSSYSKIKAEKPTSFIAQIRTKNEFVRGGDDKKTYGDYKSYVQAMADKYLDTLSDGNLKWLEENGYI